MEDMTRRDLLGLMGAMGAMGGLLGMAGCAPHGDGQAMADTSEGQTEAAAATEQPAPHDGVTDGGGVKAFSREPQEMVRTQQEAHDFLMNPQMATEDYTLADGTVIPAVYLNLRNRWNRLGVGFGSKVDDGGDYWTLLMKIFTEEEAGWYMELPIFELFTPNDYHAISGRPEAECREICDHLAKMGVLPRFMRGGIPYYYLTNQHLGQPKFYQDEEYLHAGLTAPDANDLQYDQGTPTYQVSPVNVDVVAESEILAYDDWRAIVERNETFQLCPCVCKAMQASFKGQFDWMEERDARYDDGNNKFCINTCIAMGELAEYYVYEDYGEPITKEEAIAIIERSIDEGLVVEHFYGKGAEVICQCHVDTCFLLGAMKSIGGMGDAVPTMSNYMLELDKDACIKCGTCLERCPLHAVTFGDDGFPQMDMTCARCGQCALKCPAGARVLRAKPAEEQLELPENVCDDWYKKGLYRAMKGTLYDFVG